MDTFSEQCNLLRQTQDGMVNLTRPLSTKEIEFVVHSNTKLGPMVSLVNSVKHLSERIYQSSETEEEETPHNGLNEASMTMIPNLTKTFQRKKINTLVMSNRPPSLVSKLLWIWGLGGEEHGGLKIMQSNLMFFRFLWDLDRNKKRVN